MIFLMGITADDARGQIKYKGDPVLHIVENEQARDADLTVADQEHDAFQSRRDRSRRQSVHHPHQDHIQEADIHDLEINGIGRDPGQKFRQDKHDRDIQHGSREHPHPGQAAGKLLPQGG